MISPSSRRAGAGLGRARAAAVALAAGTAFSLATPAAAAELRAQLESAMSIACSEAVCECVDAELSPIPCPATDVHADDSGPATSAVQRAYTNEIQSFFHTFDSRTSAFVALDGSADFGALRVLAMAHTDAGGESVVDGADALPGEATGTVTVAQSDVLTVHGPQPGAPVQLRLAQSVSSRGEAGCGAGSPVQPCDANAEARSRIRALLTVAPSGQQAETVEYERIVHSCDAVAIVGQPLDQVEITVQDGDTVSLSQSVEAEAFVRMDGGPFSATRVLDADAYVDGSETVLTFVRVLTPGASYTTESGVQYAAPEPGELASAAAALAALDAARRARARRT